MDIEQAFAGMAKAEIFGKGNYFDEGSFIVEIVSLKVKEGYKGKSFIAELRVAENIDGRTKGPDGKPVGPDQRKTGADGQLKDPAGALRSWVVKLEKKQAFGDLKSFMLALNGDDPSKVAPYEVNPAPHNEATTMLMCAVNAEKAKENGLPENWAVGQKLRLDTVKIMTTTTQPPHPFTVHRWSPHSSETSDTTATEG